MEKDYTSLLKTVIEIEGLLSLLQHNQSGDVERVTNLITEKVAILADAFASARVDEPNDITVVKDASEAIIDDEISTAWATETAETAVPAKVADVTEAAEATEPAEEVAAVAFASDEDEIANQAIAAATFEEEIDDADPFDVDDDDNSDEETQPEVIVTTFNSPATVPHVVPPVYMPEVKAIETVTEELKYQEPIAVKNEPSAREPEKQVAPMRLDEKLAIKTSRDIRRAFTLNDRFRFRRELFENSEARFAEALDVIMAMSSYDEAEEYFYDDLCWNADSEDVKDFMQKVFNHFQ
ncbi:MAG: hypothetical protein J1E63_05975 [Muribaculaceae bacterium]|nr:hypothetical protein [Muribaculaceae bacterium]